LFGFCQAARRGRWPRFELNLPAVASRHPRECATHHVVPTEWEVRGHAPRGGPGGNMSEGLSPSPRGTRPGFAINTPNFLCRPVFAINTHNWLGGSIVAVLAVFFLAFAFYIPNALTARFLAAALLVIGIGAAVGLLPVHAPRDLYGGLALVMLATFALIASAD